MNKEEGKPALVRETAAATMKSGFHNVPWVLLGPQLMSSAQVMPLWPKPFNQTL